MKLNVTIEEGLFLQKFVVLSLSFHLDFSIVIFRDFGQNNINSILIDSKQLNYEFAVDNPFHFINNYLKLGANQVYWYFTV
jgi:hypothetical protein